MESSAAQLSSCSPGVLHKERQVSQPRARGKFTLSSLPGNQESSPVGVRSKDWARWEAVSPHVKEDGPSFPCDSVPRKGHAKEGWRPRADRKSVV